MPDAFSLSIFLKIQTFGQMVGHVVVDARFEGMEGALVADGPELRHIGLGEILVRGADVFGDINVLNLRGQAQRLEGILGQIEEGTRLARAQVVNARVAAVVHQKDANFNDVFDIHEVTHLVAIGKIGAMRAEKRHLARLLDFLEGMPNHRSHAAFVVFIGAIHIEKFEARPEKRFLLLLERPHIKILFRLAVRIEWFELWHLCLVVVVAQLTGAVSRCRGGIHQGDLIVVAFFPDGLRVVQVEAVKNTNVPLGGIGASTQMKTELNVGLVGIEPIEKLVAMDKGLDFLIGQVFHFSFIREVIHSNDEVEIILGQTLNQTASDEAGGTCYYDHIERVSTTT
jgi:hypothetical protein